MPNRTLLIATPDRALAEKLFHRTVALDFRVKLVYDAQTAARRAVDWRPELLLIDDRMTGIDGWSLAELMLLEPVAPETRLLLLVDSSTRGQNSSSPDAELIDRGRDIVAQIQAILAPCDTQQADYPFANETDTHDTPAITLGEMLSNVKTGLGGIPSINPTAPGSNRSLTAPRALSRVGQPAAIPRQQLGTQQPRASRQRFHPGIAHSQSAEFSNRAPQRGRTAGESYLIDAAFADYRASVGEVSGKEST